MDGEPAWGVTAVQAVEEMDAGPIWASRDFPVPADPPRKSALYNGPITDTAMQLIHEVITKAVDPGFRPEPLDYTRPDVRGRLRPQARPPDRAFAWSDPTEHILRRIRAADGSPGVHDGAVRAVRQGLRRAPRDPRRRAAKSRCRARHRRGPPARRGADPHR